MGDTPADLLPTLLQGMAAATDSDQGLAELLRAVGQSQGATAVHLDFLDAGRPALTWARAAVPAGAPSEVAAVRVAGKPVAQLVVHQPGSAGDLAQIRRQLAAVADLCAIVIGRDDALRRVQQERTDRLADVAQHRAFIERVIDSLPLALYVVDREYRIDLWNHAREVGLQGIARAEAIGRTIFEVLHRQPAERLRTEFDAVFATGQLQQFHMESDAYGERRTFRISKIPMRLDGEAITHVITVGEDITGWQAALERSARAEKLAAIGQLAAGVMHEINNPLATIAACTESIALQAELGAGATPPSELLRIIDLEVERCRKIVDGLLDFSRPKPASHEPLDINELVQRALLLLQHHPRFKRVDVVLALEAEAPLLVAGDGDQLVQVVIALAMNAVDVTPERGRVFLRTRRETLPSSATSPTSPRVLLEIEDEGPGIPPAVRAKIFEPFFTTKPVGQGTGLGLAICYGIVADHGGEVALVSPEGRGAIFHVLLPSAPAVSNAASGTP